MKYKLDSARTNFKSIYSYGPTDSELKEIKTLKELGFKFNDDASKIDTESLPEIEINTIAELEELQEKVGDLIFNGDAILIYNYYIE